MTRMYAGPAFLNLASSGLLLNFCGIYNLSSLGLLIISWWLNWGIASSSSYHLPFVERVSCLVSWLTVIFYQDLCLNTCQFRSVPTLCDPMNRSMPGLPVHHQLPEFTQTHVHWWWWCHPAISSSVIPFSSCPQSFPVSGSFPMSQFFALGGQSIGVSASATVLPMNTQDW